MSDNNILKSVQAVVVQEPTLEQVAVIEETERDWREKGDEWLRNEINNQPREVLGGLILLGMYLDKQEFCIKMVELGFPLEETIRAREMAVLAVWAGQVKKNELRDQIQSRAHTKFMREIVSDFDELTEVEQRYAKIAQEGALENDPRKISQALLNAKTKVPYVIAFYTAISVQARDVGRQLVKINRHESINRFWGIMESVLVNTSGSAQAFAEMLHWGMDEVMLQENIDPKIQTQYVKCLKMVKEKIETKSTKENMNG